MGRSPPLRKKNEQETHALDLNLALYLSLFLLLVGLFLFSLVRRRQEEAREKGQHSEPERGPVDPEAEGRGQGE
jgi:hypothetical protein